MTTTTSAFIGILPNELLIQIATYLDTPAPSVSKFAHEPTTSLTHSDHTPLKSLSLVSQRCRKIVLPLLFRYTRLQLDENPQWVPIDARLLDDMQSQLSTLSSHELQVYQRMRSKFKTSAAFAYDEVFDDLLINLCRIEDDDAFLKNVPHILWFPHLPRQAFADFCRFVKTHDMKKHIKSVVLFTDKKYELHHVSSADAHLAKAVAEIWTQIFSRLEPVRVVVAAPPTSMAGLLDAQVMSSDTWAFDMKMHYLELLQTDPVHGQQITHTDAKCRPWDATLVHRRPWTHLNYNEGSSITAYSTYEYHLKQSPKMLYLILLRLAKEVQDCCNIRSFSFVGVFPFSTNISAVIKALQAIPTLHSVSFQLAPGPENDLLTAPKRMGRAQPLDLWLEWNGCYKAIAAFLGTYDWEEGARFISVDCRVEGTVRKDAEEYVEALQKRGLGWRWDGDGVWSRVYGLDRDVVPAVSAPIVI
ncbi:hypothetical protein P280DRAFT_442 [Massarina eburnea CBS 473.64]|uniref:F-box domain-containing protein n=1 Tax=Massarina eburnea CBS 473.64 TaxID=1395130 RepID=A0A6A6SDX2_9PLEO|nr:hypothetical protein P280DRAFT_442 [Massarina eburnea CBS 473.64]